MIYLWTSCTKSANMVHQKIDNSKIRGLLHKIFQLDAVCLLKLDPARLTFPLGVTTQGPDNVNGLSMVDVWEMLTDLQQEVTVKIHV